MGLSQVTNYALNIIFGKQCVFILFSIVLRYRMCFDMEHLTCLSNEIDLRTNQAFITVYDTCYVKELPTLPQLSVDVGFKFISVAKHGPPASGLKIHSQHSKAENKIYMHRTHAHINGCYPDKNIFPKPFLTKNRFNIPNIQISTMEIQ